MADSDRRFSATYARTQSGWQVCVQRPAVTARGRTLESARIAAVEAIAGHFGVSPALVVLDDEVQLAAQAREAVDAALAAREAVVAAQLASASRQQEAAHALAQAGLSMRDSAYLLGVSHSHIQQLLNTTGSPRGGAR